MSRRKQAKPIRHLEDGTTTIVNGEDQTANEDVEAGEAALGSSSDPEHSSLSDAHREDNASENGEEESEPASAGSGGHHPPNLFLKRSVDEDFANNNDQRRRLARGGDLDDEEEAMEDTDNENRGDDDLDKSARPSAGGLSALFGGHSSPSGPMMPNATAITEQLKTISLTISQLTSNMTASSSSPKSVQELAVLQATLFSLQQQQLLYMQILAQMQQHQKQDDSTDRSSSKEASPIPSIADLAKKMEEQNSLEAPKKESGGLHDLSRMIMDSTPVPPSMPPKVSSLSSNILTGSDLNKHSINPTTTSAASQESNLPLSAQILDPNAPSSLASSIILHPEGDSDEKPVNSLELLQKRAQGILNNASQGLLANNLADFSVNKDPGFDKKGEPFFKHRCRYCGKVFGSDSALQIHVRSHTGERPYKCNVCGNRFTTKGNLKVHFQRHAHKFPNIKMNPNLVPEHLDKFYPPLLQLIEEAEKKGLPVGPLVNNPMAGMTPIFPPGFKLPNMPNLQGMPPVSAAAAQLLSSSLGSGATSPGSLCMPKFPFGGPGSGLPPPSGLFPPFPPLPSEPLKREDVPRDLSLQLGFIRPRKRSRSRSRSVSPPPSSASKMESEDVDIMRTSNNEDSDREEKMRRSQSPMDDKNSDNEGPKDPDLSGDEQPENLSRDKSRERSFSPKSITDEPIKVPSHMAKLFPTIPGFPQRLPMIPTSRPPGMPPNTSMASMGSSIDPAKDPMIYTNLLPRPGSSDNSWESLIEIEKSSETTKLEQLVNNIENKLSDPNECVICHRVLSCKSALQMHYRTHTGERPFKCRICSRAFTTKGNLKTHMGVHRAKPPMRMFHQCPVCHKKYANALVLQQHIRTHTGEPTELTAEQIAAAEIRDFPPMHFGQGGPMGGPMRHHPASSLFPGALPGYFPPVSGAASGNGSSPMSPDLYDKDDKDSTNDEKEDGGSRPSSVSSSTSSTLNTSFPITTSIPGDRPFGLVRPIQMDKLSQLSLQMASSLPEDLSSSARGREEEDGKPLNNGSRKDTASPPVSPPKYSPEPSVHEDRDDRSPSPAKKSDSHQHVNGSPRLPQAPADLPVTSAASFAAAVAALGGGNPLTSAGAPSPLMFPGFPGLLPPAGAFPGHLLGAPGAGGPVGSSAAGSVLSQLALAGSHGFNPLGLPGLPGAPGGSPGVRQMTIARGNTTCQLCFKVFACNSALEIHYRSHTKERPFKCTVCDRGFSTKGNMKQHALTHKNRDMKGSPSSSNPNSDCDQPKTPTASSRQSRDIDDTSNDNSTPSIGGGLSGLSALTLGLGLKRPTSEDDELPMSKRLQPDFDLGIVHKHSSKYCEICKRSYSSASALQIHMRTHTGDRPFKCSVCGKAFTTKGNLKVHMETHMWSSSSSSSLHHHRGRRMSDHLLQSSEFLQVRQDLSYQFQQPQQTQPKEESKRTLETAAVTV